MRRRERDQKYLNSGKSTASIWGLPSLAALQLLQFTHAPYELRTADAVIKIRHTILTCLIVLSHVRAEICVRLHRNIVKET
jgi:hypothetical protein